MRNDNSKTPTAKFTKRSCGETPTPSKRSNVVVEERRLTLIQTAIASMYQERAPLESS